VSQEVEYQTQRLDHLGIVAGVCKEAGIAEWLDKRAGENRRIVSVGTAVVAMILNGLGFSNRQLYLVPQFFANKPVEHLLGEGITADMLNDDTLGRTLDWIYEHDPTMLFAGLALQARQHFGFKAEQVHIDTTSFSVSGEYLSKEKTSKEPIEEEKTGKDLREEEKTGKEPIEEEAIPIAITYGYSRDHRADLKQWMMGLVTTHDGDIPIFMRPLDGNSSDKESISAIVTDVMTQLRQTLPTEEQEPLAVFDSGGYSQANMTRYNQAKLKWISRVPETSTEAKAALQEETADWHQLSDGSGQYRVCIMDLPQGKERWVIVRTEAGEQAARKQLEKKVKKAQEQIEKKLWHLSKQEFACQQDAEAACKQAIKGTPSFLTVSCLYQEEGRYRQKGRPKTDAAPDYTVWHVVGTLTIDKPEVEAQIRKQASFILATNVIEEQELSHEQVYVKYKEQGGAERGFRFLKDPLFLASSVFVKKPERVVALSFIMVLCLLVYRLAERLLRSQLAATEQTVPNQVNKPTDRPTMRWIFQCFEGIDLLHIRIGSRLQTQVLGLQALHRQVLRLLGPPYLHFYLVSP
jgi:transposase